jgi:hypothetical protein
MRDNIALAMTMRSLGLFQYNIRRVWKNSDKYYNKIDVTLTHRAAVLLHPRLE